MAQITDTRMASERQQRIGPARRVGAIVLFVLAVAVGVAGAAGVFLGLTLLGVGPLELLLVAALVAAALLTAAVSLLGRRVMPLHNGRTVTALLTSAAVALSSTGAWMVLFQKPTSPQTYITPAVDLAKPQWVTFAWAEATLGERTFERAAVLIPVRLNNLPDTYYMQLDTGVPFTTLYERPLQSLATQHADVASLVDRDDLTFKNDWREMFVFNNAQLTLGDGVRFTATKIPVLKEFGQALEANATSPEQKLIGTIGLDAVAGRTLMLDYNNSRLAITSAEPTTADYTLVPARLEHEAFKVPVQIDGKEQLFLLDTGSSLFNILTTRAEYNRLTSNAKPEDEIPGVTTWGTAYTVYGATTTAELQIGDRLMPPVRAYYHPAPFFALGMVQTRVAGIIGNEFFGGDIIALDFKNQRLGIKLP